MIALNEPRGSDTPSVWPVDHTSWLHAVIVGFNFFEDMAWSSEEQHTFRLHKRQWTWLFQYGGSEKRILLWEKNTAVCVIFLV